MTVHCSFTLFLTHKNTLKCGITVAIPLKAGGSEEAIKCWSKDAFAFQVGVSIVPPKTLRVLTYISTLRTGLWRRDETGEQTLLPADGSLNAERYQNESMRRTKNNC